MAQQFQAMERSYVLCRHLLFVFCLGRFPGSRQPLPVPRVANPLSRVVTRADR